MFFLPVPLDGQSQPHREEMSLASMENLYPILPDDREFASSESSMCHEYEIDDCCHGLFSHDGLFALVDFEQCVVEVLVEGQCGVVLQMQVGVVEED